MMPTTVSQSRLVNSLAERFAGPLFQSREDLLRLSNLHPDFVRAGFAIIDRSKERVEHPSSGELVAHLAMQGLELADNDRRMLAAAWLSLLSYMSIVDHELDQKGYLNGRSSLAASAMLGWGIATIGRYTAGTQFEHVFLDNINKAFAAQYEDIKVRGDYNADRRESDADKNRALIAAIAGFCAAAGMTDDRLVRSAEEVLGTFQILDDLQDLQEDFEENNATIFVRIAKECAATVGPLTRSEMYGAIIRDPRTTSAMLQVSEGIDKALLILDADRDRDLVQFFHELRSRNVAVIQALNNYQRTLSSVKEPEVFNAIQEMFMSSG